MSFDYIYFFVIFMSLILPWFPEQKAQVLNSMVLNIWGDSVSMYYNYEKIQNNFYANFTDWQQMYFQLYQKDPGMK